MIAKNQKNKLKGGKEMNSARYCGLLFYFLGILCLLIAIFSQDYKIYAVMATIYITSATILMYMK